MHQLPTGTVTLLFSDIEGSTLLLQQLGEGYSDLLAHCRQVLRTVFQQHHGHEVDTQGDSFFVAFARATDAVSAAAAAQCTLAAQTWPQGIAVRVRMGLHTGEPQLAAEGYVGLDVHQAARIMHAAYGGQVLLSQTTVNLVEQDLPEGVCLQPMRSHRLKDMPRPISLFQLVIAGLPAEFPPLKTLAAHPNYLPVPLTPFIGRAREVVALHALLNREEVRLLTLTGPGGTGKTRLGLQAVTEQQEQFADGVYFVNLAPVRDPEVVLATIAQTLALKETGTLPLFDLLLAFLCDKQLLLLLDNFEQVLGAAPQVANLLARCPQLKIVVTSRERLHVQGEQEFAVPPLAVPDPNHLPDLVAFSQYEAVTLFIQRAQAVESDFQITNATAAAVADICVRLDGLPLAIELAAARSKLLPPQALLARLGRRLAVLTSGPRDMPLRQQTLRNTIAWSYDLLNTQEQRLFQRLSVFVGGCTFEAIEAICTALDGVKEAGQVLDSVASLLDKSLIRQRTQQVAEPRLWMLETLREFGLEALTANGEMETVQRAHAAYYLALAQRLGTYPQQPSAQLGLEPLERDHDNLRAALQWALEQGERELALRAGGALWWFWAVRGPLSEGRIFLEKALTGSEGMHTFARAKALYGAAVLAFFPGDWTQTTLLCEESLALYQQLGDKDGIATCLYRLGNVAIVKKDYIRGGALEEQALAIFRETGNQWGSSVVYLRLGQAALYQRDFLRARSLFEVSVAISRTLGDTYGILTTLGFLGQVANCQGEYERAGPLFEESLAMARELDDKLGIIGAIYGLMEVALWQNDLVKVQALSEEFLARQKEFGGGHQEGVAGWRLSDRARIELRLEEYTNARVHFQESLALARAWGEGDFMELIGCCFVGLAEVATVQHQPAWAARLWGAAEIIHDGLDLPMPTQFNERPLYERAVAQARADLGEHAFAAAWAEGRTMTPEQALASEERELNAPPISTVLPLPAGVPSPVIYPDGLTAREVEVLRLVAQGLSNAEIAEQLIISLLTVKAHMRSLYNKLSISSRSAATRYAIEHHLTWTMCPIGKLSHLPPLRAS